MSDDAAKELKGMWKILEDQAEHVISALDNTDKKDINIAQKDERKLDKLADKLEKNHIGRLKKGKCKVMVGVIFLEMVNELEKIGDHLSNIADRAPEIQQHHLELGG